MDTTSFYAYLLRSLPTADLVEVSELFPRQKINDLFIKDIDKLLEKVPPGEMREDLQRFRQMDFVGYLDGSLRRAGFQDHELDELVSEIVSKLLLGGLFTGWTGQSLVGRFKVSVANAIRTLMTRRSKSRRRSHELPEDLAFRPIPHSDLIKEFRAWISARYGELAARVLDHRLDGGSTGDLLGEPGIETSYKLKQLVQRIKEAAREYFRRDPEFFERIERAFADEQRTIRKRFPARV